MEFYEYLPFWPKLTREQQQFLAQNVTLHHVTKGEVVHNGSEDCVGPLIVVHGQLRGYSFSDEGREVTLYRLFERDVCILVLGVLHAEQPAVRHFGAGGKGLCALPHPRPGLQKTHAGIAPVADSYHRADCQPLFRCDAAAGSNSL